MSSRWCGAIDTPLLSANGPQCSTWHGECHFISSRVNCQHVCQHGLCVSNLVLSLSNQSITDRFAFCVACVPLSRTLHSATPIEDVHVPNCVLVPPAPVVSILQLALSPCLVMPYNAALVLPNCAKQLVHHSGQQCSCAQCVAVPQGLVMAFYGEVLACELFGFDLTWRTWKHYLMAI